MIEIIELACRSCGAKLTIHADDDVLACGHCGSQMLVQRRGGSVSLKSVEAAIGLVQAGTDRTAAELAIVRLEKELTELLAKRVALLKTKKYSPEMYEMFRALAVRHRAGLKWTRGRRVTWGLVFVATLIATLSGAAAKARRLTGDNLSAGQVALWVIVAAAATFAMYGLKRLFDWTCARDVVPIETLDDEIARLRERIAEKTRLANS